MTPSLEKLFFLLASEISHSTWFLLAVSSSPPAPLSVSSSSWSFQVGTSGPYFGTFISLSILSLHTISPSPIVQMSVSRYQIYICNTDSASNPKLRSPCVCSKLLQSCLTLCNTMDHSQPGSSVHGILQARIVKWVAMPFSRGSSQPRDQTHISYISCISRQILYH